MGRIYLAYEVRGCGRGTAAAGGAGGATWPPLLLRFRRPTYAPQRSSKALWLVCIVLTPSHAFHTFCGTGDLRELREHVRASAALVLVQSASVLTRPYCLIEIVTAIEESVPIVAVALANTPFVYDHEDASRLLASLETRLDELNPGALAMLRAAGIPADHAARLLGGTIPHVISVRFDLFASRRVIAASVADIAAAMAEAKPLPVPSEAEWARSRAEGQQRQASPGHQQSLASGAGFPSH